MAGRHVTCRCSKRNSAEVCTHYDPIDSHFERRWAFVLTTSPTIARNAGWSGSAPTAFPTNSLSNSPPPLLEIPVGGVLHPTPHQLAYRATAGCTSPVVARNAGQRHGENSYALLFNATRKGLSSLSCPFLPRDVGGLWPLCHLSLCFLLCSYYCFYLMLLLYIQVEL
jgi:hypothetical protein